MRLTFVHAIRHLRRRPVLTSVAVLTLAVGIGSALACASLIDAVLVRAVPYRDASGLVLVWENNAKRGAGLTPTSILNYRDLAAGANAFDALGVFSDGQFSVDGPDGSERAVGYRTTAGVLDQTHVAPALGRLFGADDDRVGAPDVVVLSHGLWQRRFGGDPQVIGRTIQLTGNPYTVIGVMPRGFVLPPVFSIRLVGTDVTIKDADLWMPIKLDGLPQRRDLRMLFMLGRLKPQHGVAQAQAEATTIARRLAADHPVEDVGLDFSVVPLQTQVLSGVQALLVLLPIVAALVLVIAATDAAHLLLADALTTAGETGVRWALGASTRRLAVEQGARGIVWCTLATIGAWAIAAAIQVPVAAYAKANVPRLKEVRLDGTMGAVAIGIGLALTLAISSLPMLYARKTGSARSVQGGAAPTGMPRWRRAFVVVQLAVALVVLSTAAQLFGSAARLSRVDPGFVADGVSVFEVMLPPSRYAAPPARVAFQRRLLDEVATLPGARASAVVDYLPFGGTMAIANLSIEHHVAADAMSKPRGALLAVSRRYFDVLSIPLAAGRTFAPEDEGPDAASAIVNDAFVRRYLADGRVLGRRIKRGEAADPTPWLTIVGVVGSVRGAGLTIEPQPEVFVPYVRGSLRTVTTLIVASRAPVTALAPAIVERIHRVDAALSPTTVTTMSALVARAVGQPVFYARVFAVLAGVACLLSLAGVYGVAVLGVSARSNEIAIRSCLGAQYGDIVALIMRETALSVAGAMAAGALGAWILQKRVAAFVYGVESSDWLVIAGCGLALSALACVAVYAAVRRIVVLRPLDLLKHGAGALA